MSHSGRKNAKLHVKYHQIVGFFLACRHTFWKNFEIGCNEQLQERQRRDICVCFTLATNGRVDGGEVILEGSSRGKHLVFIRRTGQKQAGRWWWSLYTIEETQSPWTSAPHTHMNTQSQTHRACVMYALNTSIAIFHNMDILKENSAAPTCIMSVWCIQIVFDKLSIWFIVTHINCWEDLSSETI